MVCSGSHSVSPVITSFKPDGRGDVAGADFFDLAALVGVHLEQAADALFLALAGIGDRVAGS